MKPTGITCYTLERTALSALVTHSFDGLATEPTQTDEALPFIALDCFDRSLRRSGRILLQTDSEFILIGDEVGVVSQPAEPGVKFITDFHEGPVKRGLQGLSRLRSLLPIGTGKLQRYSWTLTDNEGKTHCRLFAVHLKAKNGRVAVPLAVQRVKGYGRATKLLQERIDQLGGTALDSAGLYDRLFPVRAAYQAKPAIGIAPDTMAFDAANSIIFTCIAVAGMNEAGVIADHDTEFLHDYRIQLRKIRSVLSLFRGVYDDAQTLELKARFSSLMAPTGALRDLDVYLLDKSHYYDLLPENLHGGLDGLFTVLAERRQSEHQLLSRHLESSSYHKDIKELQTRYGRPRELKRGPNAERPSFEYARDLIWKRYRKVSRIAAGITEHTPDVEVHELRIQCKKLRYLMEFFGPMFPQSAFKRLLKPMKKLQDNLGLFNDYSVQQESLGAFLAGLPRKQSGAKLAIAQSVGALTAIMHQRQLAERAKVMANLTSFNSRATRQLFSELFQQQEPQI